MSLAQNQQPPHEGPKQQSFGYQWVRKAAEKNDVVKVVFDHFHWLDIAMEHEVMWHEAKSKHEKDVILRRIPIQLSRALFHGIAIDAALHAAWYCLIQPVIGFSVLMLSIAIIAATKR